MDTLLKNGDYALCERGLPIVIDHAAELAQRAMIRLAVEKGAFSLDPELGGTLHRLRGPNAAAQAERAVMQALTPIAGLAVEEVACEQGANGELRLSVRISAQGLTLPVTVTI